MKFELTVTLRPNLYRLTATEQYDRTYQHIRDVVRPYASTIVAELTSEHNIHYHCIIDMPDDPLFERQKVVLDKFRKLTPIFGKKSFRPVQYEESYEMYIMKDLKKTLCVTSRDPVILDELKIRSKLPVEINKVAIRETLSSVYYTEYLDSHK